ncbi:MAG TPA: tRNA (adenosine(37)-N6)-threonylcarbamoyltransferase complex dimerization subunit type 1 TsaB [Solirubrobacterales bacterium]|nr:tRNA (adenosine(37)-N6)-threonylcarbamoyltransferase complex dimerization subunit type 1 TsaB [Solirubrobacterales bacterium]
MSAGAILGFDTATADAVVAVTIGGQPVSERRAQPDGSGRPRHAAKLLAEIEAAAADAGGWEAIERLAVGIGPGTFTGLRIGVTTARALAQARSLPLVGVGSLEALGLGIAERAEGRKCLPLIDARRAELFGALVDDSGQPLWDPFVAGPEQLLQRLADAGLRPLAGGDGSLRFRAQLESAGVDVLPDADPGHRMAARHVCELAAGVTPGPVTEVKPAYLRRPDAEVWREQRDRNPGERR